MKVIIILAVVSGIATYLNGVYEMKHPPKMAVRLFDPVTGRYYWIPDFPVADEKSVRLAIYAQYSTNKGDHNVPLDVPILEQSIVDLYPHAQYWQEGYPYETTIWF